MMILLMILLFFNGMPALFAQDSAILAAYERNFLRASLSTKVGILHDAATDDEAAEFIGRLYEFALAFSIQNADILRDDPDFIALTALAARGVGAAGYKPSAATLWTVFSSFRDTVIRVEAVNSLALLAPGDPVTAEHLNQFVANQNSLHRSGMTLDYVTLEACVTALGTIAGPAAIPVLFAVMTAGYPDPVPDSARSALAAISDPGEYRRYLGEVIGRSPPPEKRAAFEAGMRNSRFSDADKGELAEIALQTTLAALDTGAAADSGTSGSGGPGGGNTVGNGALAELRFAAVISLGTLRWVRAAPLVIRHYSRLYQDFAQGLAPQGRVLEAITSLGAMESAEAAQILSLQLGRINAHMESSGDWDEELTLCLITALGELGHKIAFDYLTYISYLSYPEPVQFAAKEALNRLKW
jgi:HEAT repeat protein